MLSTVSGYVVYSVPCHAAGVTYIPALTGGVLFFAPLLMILFRRKYPRWWFDWNLELQRFTNRVTVYLSLMDDRYPSTDDHQSVHLDCSYPDHRRHPLERPDDWLHAHLGHGPVPAVRLAA